MTELAQNPQEPPKLAIGPPDPRESQEARFRHTGATETLDVNRHLLTLVIERLLKRRTRPPGDLAVAFWSLFAAFFLALITSTPDNALGVRADVWDFVFGALALGAFVGAAVNTARWFRGLSTKEQTAESVVEEIIQGMDAEQERVAQLDEDRLARLARVEAARATPPALPQSRV